MTQISSLCMYDQHACPQRSPTWPTNTTAAEIEDEQHREQILAAFPDVRTKVLIKEGSIDDHLESAIRSHSVDLVVIGTTGQTQMENIALGRLQKRSSGP